MVLHLIAILLLYTYLFLTVFGHFTFSTYVFSTLRCNALIVFSSREAAEAATGGVLQERVFLEISQNSQENSCARLSFLI